MLCPGEIKMPIKINKPTVIDAAGNKPKVIEEYIGFVNSQTSDLSIARMKSPSGWVEPGQKPEFKEYTIVLKGMLRVKTTEEQIDIHAGEAIIVKANEWVQYSTPNDEGAEYIAVCLPAFSPDTVHRDE
jgi:mannose-6-phosphate isomerase-like protein (cupin superfamily)